MEVSLTFEKIVFMVEEMAKCLSGDEWKPLRMTLRLLNLGVKNANLRKKHVDHFASFCSSNKNAIMEMDKDALVEPTIFYSDGVYIDFKRAFEHLDDEETLWQHLVCVAMDYEPSLRENESVSKLIKLSESEEQGMGEMFQKSLKVVDELFASNGGGDFENMLKKTMESDMFKELTNSLKDMFEGGVDKSKFIQSLQNTDGFGDVMKIVDKTLNKE